MSERQRIPIPRRSLYIKRNKAREWLLAILVVVFVSICVIVLGSTFVPMSSDWSDSVLVKMIVETNEFVRGRAK
ncbi:MAG: hypothetical protein LBS45_10540 [Synergistaceae bacterium]|nr:hypothetical protein [Synergistaceae bacterium]